MVRETEKTMWSVKSFHIEFRSQEGKKKIRGSFEGGGCRGVFFEGAFREALPGLKGGTGRLGVAQGDLVKGPKSWAGTEWIREKRVKESKALKGFAGLNNGHYLK